VRHPNIPPSRRDDWIAAALSVVPGLGQLYKGHLLPGVLVLCVIGPAYLALVLALVPATRGVSLIFAVIFIGVAAAHAFRLRDVRRNPGPFEHARLTLERWFGHRHRHS
jgi:hypothetical protein